MGSGKTLQVPPPQPPLLTCTHAVPAPTALSLRVSIRVDRFCVAALSSGCAVQSIILALLFMAVRAQQRQHSRVVMLVPANVLYNCMHELRLWLGEFTTGDVVDQGGQLTLVRLL